LQQLLSTDSGVDNYIYFSKSIYMEILLILKILFIIGAIIAGYAILRNLDIIKIILVYFKDLILRK